MSFSYKELRGIEKTRRSLLRQCEAPVLNIVCKWKGTCLRILVTDPLVWISFGIYVSLRVYYTVHDLPAFLVGFVAGSNGNIIVIGAFMTFILAYYAKEGLNRFDNQYELCMSAKESVLDVASLARSHLPREQGLRIVRYMNASHAAGFVGLSEVYSYQKYFLEVNKSMLLLTENELRRVAAYEMDNGGSCYREIIQWVQIEIKDLMDSGTLDKHTAKQFRTKLLEFQSSLSKLYNFADQPIPFFYIHFVCLVSTLYLPLFSLFCIHAISLQILDTEEESKGRSYEHAMDVGMCFIMFLQSSFVIGLRAIGRKLSGPFGDDYEDLSVMSHITYTWKHSSRILVAEKPVSNNQNSMTETEILLKRVSVGDTWMKSDKILFINEEIAVNSTTSISTI